MLGRLASTKKVVCIPESRFDDLLQLTKQQRGTLTTESYTGTYTVNVALDLPVLTETKLNCVSGRLEKPLRNGYNNS